MTRTLEMNVLEAAEKGTVLVCLTPEQVETILEEAIRLGVEIPTPILMSDYSLFKERAALK